MVRCPSILKLALSLALAATSLFIVLHVSAHTAAVSCASAWFHFGQDLVLACDSTGQLYRASDTNWQAITAPLQSAAVTVAPDDTVYLYSQTLWRSTDKGHSWELVGQPSPYFFDVFPSPVSGTLFLTVRNIPAAAAPGADPWWGILKSTNGGLTWTQVLTDGSGQYISISPGFASDGTAFASPGYYHGALGIWKTTDGGDTWVPVNNGLQTGVQCLGPHPWVVVSPQFSQDQTAFTSDCTGLFKTTNGGQSWVKVNDIAPYTAPALSPNYRSDQILVADDRWSGLWLSHDGGQTFAQVRSDTVYASGIRYQLPFEPAGVTTTPPISAAWQVYVPAIYATPDLEFWAVAKNAPSSTPCYLYRSRDYGQTWQEVPVLEATSWAYLPVMNQ